MSNFLDLPTHLPNSIPDDQQPEVAAAEETPVVTPDQPRKDEPVYIPGTTITLETEEDIQKWIEERRKRWPTKKNVEANISAKESLKRPNESEDASAGKRQKQICKFYQNNKTCKFGNKCKNLHELSSDFKVINGIKVRVPKRFENDYYVKDNSSEKSSLFKMLMKKEQYELENSKFIEFLMYMNEKGLIKHDYDNDGNPIIHND